MKKLTCYACDRDVETGVWIDEGEQTFYCTDCFKKNAEQFPSWEHAKKRYVTKKNG